MKRSSIRSSTTIRPQLLDTVSWPRVRVRPLRSGLRDRLLPFRCCTSESVSRIEIALLIARDHSLATDLVVRIEYSSRHADIVSEGISATLRLFRLCLSRDMRVRVALPGLRRWRADDVGGFGGIRRRRGVVVVGCRAPVVRAEAGGHRRQTHTVGQTAAAIAVLVSDGQAVVETISAVNSAEYTPQVWGRITMCFCDGA